MLELMERAVEAHERQAAATERLAAAAERQAGTATARQKKAQKGARPRRVPQDAPVDDVSQKRAEKCLRNSGFRVDD